MLAYTFHCVHFHSSEAFVLPRLGFSKDVSRAIASDPAIDLAPIAAEEN
jgi:hypothetical protein